MRKIKEPVSISVQIVHGGLPPLDVSYPDPFLYGQYMHELIYSSPPCVNFSKKTETIDIDHEVIK